MVFNSFHYLIFFPIVCCLFFISSGKVQTVILLIASYYFYMAWKPVYALLLLATTTIDYFCALRIDKSKIDSHRKWWLAISVTSNLVTLFTFKYFNFASDTIFTVAKQFGYSTVPPYLELILPIGISFYTFQSIAYVIDVYRRNTGAEGGFFTFATFVSFFPHLVAGPINRSQDLLTQLKVSHRFDAERTVSGLKLIAWGLMKKICIGDQLALIVDPVFTNPASYQGPTLAVATVCFAFQIYCDFSGYSDIAIGSAWIMGVRLMRNFNSPYLAISIVDFWRRWHISLSTWFRDYVYIPMGGSRASGTRFRYNIATVFLLSGAWHGAKWTFVLWGAIHAIFYFFSHTLEPWLQRTNLAVAGTRRAVSFKAAQVLATFSVVTFAWIFFRANSVSDAFYVTTHLVSGWSQAGSELAAAAKLFFNFGPFTATVMATVWCSLIVFMFWAEAVENPMNMFADRPMIIRWGCYFLVVLAIVMLGSFGSASFIYFQF